MRDTQQSHLFERAHHYINGTWVIPHSTKIVEVIDPFTEQRVGSAPLGDAVDVAKAVAAARSAFPLWSGLSPSARAQYLRRIRTAVEKRTDIASQLATREMGVPITNSRKFQVGRAVSLLEWHSEFLESAHWHEKICNSAVIKEPIGVVGGITPWNSPFYQPVSKVVPALAAGCTIVIKPSELTPLSCYLLADIIHECDLPPGVFNMVNGDGPIVGEALALDPNVDMIAYTGSTRAGRRVMQCASNTIKKVTLELGGKSPSILLSDADFPSAISQNLGGVFRNAGQTCFALTRVLVPKERHKEAVSLAVAVAQSVKLGNPMDEDTQMGPLATSQHREKVRACIEFGVEEGALLVCGGVEQPRGLQQGLFVAPTIFADVHNKMRIAQEEIFGPVVCVIPYEDEDAAIEIANDTDYGLSAAVWSNSTARAVGVARQLRAGNVDINGGVQNGCAPFGGYKQSGLGRERGRYGMDEFLEIKSVQFRNEELVTQHADRLIGL